jgi:hypothetical protein
MLLKTLRFGIEIETVGLSRSDLARAIHSALPGSSYNEHPSLREQVTLADGRIWKVVPDGSLAGYLNGEVVSPILTYTDLDALQNVVRAVRAAGATVDASCGIHVHVCGAAFDARGVTNLVKNVYRNERLIEHALGVSPTRLSRYCQPINEEFIERINRARPRTRAEMQAAWYGDSYTTPSRYDNSRYHGLNLNSLWFRNTVEFRYFTGTLHAGKVKAFVQLSLALAAHAMGAKSASGKRKPFDAATARYQCRIFLKALGLVGDEFKTCRHHLTTGLAGHCNFRGLGPDAARAARANAETETAETDAEETDASAQ